MDDWSFCRASLREVSRTFAIPIGMLRDPLEVAVTCGYLLCRVVDTVEDAGHLAVEDKDALYAAFLDVVEGRAEPARFLALAARHLRSEDPDDRLCRRLDAVLRVFEGLPAALREPVRRWVAEMGRGMAIYSHRSPGDDGLVALLTLSDLERYCYFVAGTVGHMLTELFVAELEDLPPAGRHQLQSQAEEFGLGLQLVNILKDITDDRARGWSFIPRAICAAEGLAVDELTDADRRATAHAALAPVFARAERALTGAFAYCLAIPAEARDVRLFCLLPLWMAVRTLAHARGNDAQLEAGQPVKITRDEVGRIVAECQRLVADDDGLREAWSALRGGSTSGMEVAA